MSTTTETYDLTLIEETDALEPTPINTNTQRLEDILADLDARLTVVEAAIATSGTADEDTDEGESSGETEGEGADETDATEESEE